MVKITQNIQNTPSTLLIKQIASQISALTSTTGAPILNLSQGTPNLPLFDSAYNAALQCLQSRHLPYTDVAGDVSVRRVCADFVNQVVLGEKKKEEGVVVYGEEHVCLTNGAVGAIYNILSIQVSSNKDVVVAPLPSYGLYKSDTTLLGGTFVPLQCGGETGFAMRAEDIRNVFETHKEKLRVLILCYPNNPTGTCLSEQETKDIANELERQYKKYPDTFSILLDEVYTGIAAATSHCSILKYASAELKRVIFMVLSISKGLGGAPGARAGFVVCADRDVMEHILKVQMATGANISVVSQQLLHGSLEYILSDADSVLERVQSHYMERVSYVCDRLEEMGRKFGGYGGGERYFCPKRSEGTFYVVGQFLCGGYFSSDLDVMVAFRDAYKMVRRRKKEEDDAVSSHEQKEETIASHGVAVIPLSAFSMDEKLCLVRICCAVDMEILCTAMDVIEAVVKDAML